MSSIAIGTCVRHVPPGPHQPFIGSGVVFDVSIAKLRCSIVLLDGRLILDLSLRTLRDGSWVISHRKMTSGQIQHLLLHASEWEQWHQEKLAECAHESACCPAVCHALAQAAEVSDERS